MTIPIIKFRHLFIIVLAISLFLLPQLGLMFMYRNSIYTTVDSLPVKEYGVLFGARVYGENQLSDAAKERADATVLLFKNHKINRIFVSGANRANAEAENLAKYLMSQGVPEDNIVIDKLGIDTNDTCRHLQDKNITNAILITQAFHLPRALAMCHKKDTDFVGVEVNQLGLLSDRGGNLWQIAQIRVTRFFRESLLTWSYLLGIYDWYSHEAETLEV